MYFSYNQQSAFTIIPIPLQRNDSYSEEIFVFLKIDCSTNIKSPCDSFTTLLWGISVWPFHILCVNVYKKKKNLKSIIRLAPPNHGLPT